MSKKANSHRLSSVWDSLGQQLVFVRFFALLFAAISVCRFPIHQAFSKGSFFF
jgi:hypothetical protein